MFTHLFVIQKRILIKVGIVCTKIVGRIYFPFVSFLVLSDLTFFAKAVHVSCSFSTFNKISHDHLLHSLPNFSFILYILHES